MRITKIIAGLILIAFCVAAGAKIIHDKSWEDYIMEGLLCFAGVVAFFCAEEWSDWTGGYGWTRSTFRITPDWYIRIIGFLLAFVSSLFILLENHYEQY